MFKWESTAYSQTTQLTNFTTQHMSRSFTTPNQVDLKSRSHTKQWSDVYPRNTRHLIIFGIYFALSLQLCHSCDAHSLPVLAIRLFRGGGRGLPLSVTNYGQYNHVCCTILTVEVIDSLENSINVMSVFIKLSGDLLSCAAKFFVSRHTAVRNSNS